MKCPECDFTCYSFLDLRAHCKETSHKPKGDWTTADSEETEKDQTMAAVPGVIPEHIRRSILVLQDYVSRKDREPLLGLEYILEYKVQVSPYKKETRYFCEICGLDHWVVPILDHMCGLKHRKLYVAKVYPYVLKALHATKDDKALFMRRMALEIEREEGTKTYKTDPIIRTVPMTNVKATAAKRSKRNTRWNDEGDRQIKMNQALQFLDSLEIENENDATTVEMLSKKLMEVLKVHSNKLKEEAVFSKKVSNAKKIAMSLMQNAKKGRWNPSQKIPSLLNLFVPPKNINMGMPGGPPLPNAAFSQEFPLNQKIDYQIPITQGGEPESDESDEDIEFFNQLMALLEIIPESTMLTDSSPINSKLLLLKSLLLDETDLENTPTDQSLPDVILKQDMASTENASLDQLLAAMPSQNTAPVVALNQNLSLPMQNAEENQNALMRIAELLQNGQMNISSLFPENQNNPNKEFIQRDHRSANLMDQTAYRPPYMKQPGCASTSRNNEGFGYDGLMAGNHRNLNRQPYDDIAMSMDSMSNEPTRDLYGDRRYESGMYNRERNESSYSNISGRGANYDYTSKQAPYTRDSLSPDLRRLENERFQDQSYMRNFSRDIRSDDTRLNYGVHGSRSFHDAPLAEREIEMHYAKRLRLDNDRITAHSRDRRNPHPDRHDSRDINTANLSADLLQMIRGKDLFTASEMIGEYRDNHPYN